jgi:hypothetical protein
MRSIHRAFFLAALGAGPALAGASCSGSSAPPDLGPSTFRVRVTAVNGNPLPTASHPLPPNPGTVLDAWTFTIQAVTPTGDSVTDFNGWVRLRLDLGTVSGVTSTTNQATGRNILLQNGAASGTVQVTGAFGPTRLWVDDLGYVPAPPGVVPQCSNGVDDNGNTLVDFPADPGCYFADDNTEDGGTYAAGVSPPVQYSLPSIADVRGGARTPYPNEAIQIATAPPHDVVVTRVSSNGFFVTDTSLTGGYNSLFAFNFSTPANLRICDRITQLSGTASDFYGFTQLSFPSYQNTYVVLGLDGGVVDVDGGVPGCQVPEPTVIDPTLLNVGSKDLTAKNLYPFEAGLVRIVNFTIPKNFGVKLAQSNDMPPRGNIFGPGQSNCDYNGDGVIDFTQTSQSGCVGLCEGDCATACDGNRDCTEWTAFNSRGEYKVGFGTCAGTAACMGLVGDACTAVAGCTWVVSTAQFIKINTGTVPTFDPTGHVGETIDALTGSLTEFSGGNLNWTIEARCTDDLVCPADKGCTTQQPIPVNAACVRPRTLADNDEGSN